MAVYNLNGNDIGHGIPAGGSSGQYLKKASATDFDALWGSGGGGGGSSVDPYNSNPSALGASASPGVSDAYARGDHVHQKPSASDIGALPSGTTAGDIGGIPAPSSPETGAFLVWSGSAWVAQTITEWQGGSY